MPTNLSHLSAFIFDLDGTLVTSSINFAELQSEIGCDVGADVLQYASACTDETERRRIMDIVEAAELLDAQTSELIEGALRFLNALVAKGIPIAIVTRNFRDAAGLKIKRAGLPVEREWVLTREDAPPKPAPDALLLIAKRWGLPPEEIAYVGDYHFDVDAAHNAGMLACLRLASHSKNTDYARRADYCFERFSEFERTLFEKEKIA